MNIEDINIIKKSISSLVVSYQNELFNNELKNYDMYVDDSNNNLTKLLVDYNNECQLFCYKKKLKLRVYEKAACLAIAIKNNPFFIMRDKISFTNCTTINNFFAIDVALKFCEASTIGMEDQTFEKMFNEYEELGYSKLLLVDILEQRDVYPNDLSDSFRLQSSLLINIINSKKLKIKKLI